MKRLPTAFYAAALSVDPVEDFDYGILLAGQKNIERKLKQLNDEWERFSTIEGWSGKERNRQQRSLLEIAAECGSQGIRFLPPDMNLSDPHRFVPENETIRLPFNCPEWLDNASENIILRERAEQPFASFADFADRTQLPEYVLWKVRKEKYLTDAEEGEKLHFIKLGSAADYMMQKESLQKAPEKPTKGEAVYYGEMMKSGIRPLDEKLVAFERGHFYAIGGRPGMGKTALLLQIAKNIAATSAKPVYILSPGLYAEGIVRRMVMQMTDIDLSRMKDTAP